MTKKKKRWIIFGAIFGGILAIVEIIIALTFPWNIVYIGALLSEDPPKPEISYAEFPFELVYEINGERKEIKDTLIIEYEGVYWLGTSKRNDWKTYCKSQIGTDKYLGDYKKENFVLFYGTVDGIDSYVRIEFNLGSCEYYMGLEESYPSYEMFRIQPGDVFMDCSSYTGPISDEELYEKFNIKIIKKSISPPIKTRTESPS
ncbi:MAG: hypothetical protein IJN93_07415 [Clostridia bacterium]|nr:hypothetical protein [Clostridia bacterium]